MLKINKDFMNEKEVLFVGYSSRNSAYSKEIFKAFTNHQMKVYPYNTKENATYDIKVYENLAELPVIPKLAYLLLNKENNAKAVKELVGKGIKKILFHSAKAVDADTLAACEKAGIETAAGCPLMLFGGGMHKLHAFFAGVKSV